MNTRRQLMDSWRSRHIFGVYRPAFELLERYVGWPHGCLILADQALLGPLDPAFGRGTVYVEESLPAWRLSRLVEASTRFLWPSDRAGRARLCQGQLQDASRVTSQSVTLERLVTNPLNNESKGWFSGLSPEVGGPGSTVVTDYRHYMLSEFKRAFAIRLRDPLAFTEPDVPEIVQPVITFYEDGADATLGPTADISTAFGAYHELINHSVCFALIGDGDIQHLHPIEDAMRRLVGEILEQGGSEVPSSVDPAEVTSVFRVIHPSARSALRF